MNHHMDKPVHKALEDYDLLKVAVIQNSHKINMSAAMLWRMNLCAASTEIPCTFFVAMNYRVNVYTLDTVFSPFKNPSKVLASPSARRTGGGAESPFVINAIKVSRLLQKEVLVTTSENGEVCIWKTENLDEPPMIINNEVATWGIAIHADQGLLAVSANNWRVAIYNILELTKSTLTYGTKPNNKRESLNLMGTKTKIELIGHEHNIPNIDFSETGRYLASASVDQTCRVWDITTQQIVTQKNAVARYNTISGSDSWCWSVKFIKPGHFKYALCTDKNINRTYLQRVYQGRSTSLLNLGLCHSAASPVFPINYDNVFGADEEGFDFEIYEQAENGDNIWDNQLLQAEDEAEGFVGLHGEISNEPEALNEEQEEEAEDEFEEYSDEDIVYRTDNDMEEEDDYLSPQEQLLESSEELITQPSDNMDELDSNQQDDADYEDAEESPIDDENDVEEWTTPVAFPTQAEWTLTLLNNQDLTRDGWGDEIIPRPLSDEPMADDHSVQVLHNIVQNIESDTTTEDIPTVIDHRSGWDESEADNEEQQATSEINIRASSTRSRPPPYCIPNVIKSTTSSIATLTNTNHSLGEYLMISTGKDVMLMSTTTPKMNRIRAEHNMINKVDVRSDDMLSILDRISMVEWLPELELYVAASQKGTVALMRILQVEFEGGEQACIFNNEYYLPTNVLQATPLYGMTVKKVEAERFSPIAYQIFLFYHSGNVLGYSISRKDSDLLVENLIL